MIHHAFTAADERFMLLALAQARLAGEAGEVPVGAVVVQNEDGGDGRVLATGHNQPISLNDPSAHAEVVALRAAAQKVANYRLAGNTLYVTDLWKINRKTS
jgi:tRNA(adenine34) deaminase